MLPSGGVVRLSVLPEALQGEVPPQRPMRRCSMFSAWVAEPGRASTIGRTYYVSQVVFIDVSRASWAAARMR